LPLKSDNWITCGNALRLDWLSLWDEDGKGVRIQRTDLDLWGETVDQAEIAFTNESGETFICGNPPYVGSSLQNSEQKSDLEQIFSSRIKSWKNMDYIAGWFLKAAEYSRLVLSNFAFVSTNSICQGQQVPLLWTLMYEIQVRINFAYTSFKWSNLASYNAGVTVVIVGCTNNKNAIANLYSVDINGEPFKRVVNNINPYLVAGNDLIVDSQSKPIGKLALMLKGNMPSDGGYLILSTDQKQGLLSQYPRSSQYVRIYSGSRDFIHGELRYCLWIDDDKLEDSKKILPIRERLESVREFRENAKALTTRPYAKFPHLFRQIQSTAKYSSLIIPRHTSELREYLPVGLLSKDAIVSDSALAIYDAPLWNMALIASRLHLVWIATVCGKLETRYRYSNTLGWNTFPVPTLTEQNKTDLTHCAEDILLAREHYFPAAIADMYDRDRMDSEFPLVREAHERNDEIIERIYIGRRFKNDTERLEKLFEMYSKMTSKQAPAKPSSKRKTKS
jgi:hypothetical protein